MKQTIVLTGGGTAGHVSVNEALIPVLHERGYAIHYIGSKTGIEKEIIAQYPTVTYHAISSGKLRRYFSLKNFSDPFRVLRGIGQARRLLKKLKPSVIFSKGGFVSVPVVLAAKQLKIPVVAHESDVTPGLANKIALPFSNKIFTVFEETVQHLPQEKTSWIGPIIRKELFEGKAEKGYALTGFNEHLPVFIVMGGSQGSVALNQTIRENLKTLTERYQIIHLCGKGNVDPELEGITNYCQYEFVTTELTDLLAISDYAITRAGSNAIFELAALHIPMILIPLSAAQSRGDQVLNAKLFQSLGFAEVIEEEQLSSVNWMEELSHFIERSSSIREQLKKSSSVKTASEVVDLIELEAK